MKKSSKFISFFYEVEIFDWNQNGQKNYDIPVYFNKKYPLQPFKNLLFKKIYEYLQIQKMLWTGDYINKLIKFCKLTYIAAHETM